MLTDAREFHHLTGSWQRHGEPVSDASVRLTRSRMRAARTGARALRRSAVHFYVLLSLYICLTEVCGVLTDSALTGHVMSKKLLTRVRIIVPGSA